MAKATVLDVAHYILEHLCSNKRTITTWKLQKLVYYCQAWSLVWDERKLFEERIEAWADGPVCPELYERHKGKWDLRIGDIQGNTNRLNETAKETINVVLDYYGKESGSYLRALTHMERPWEEARGDTPPGYRSDNEIPCELMLEYYGGLVEE